MAERWIFQDIVDIEKEINSMESMKQLFGQSVRKWLDEFFKMQKDKLHKKRIKWTLWAGYCLWKRDIYVSLSQFVNEVQQMYRIDKSDIISWLNENKQEHHIITQ